MLLMLFSGENLFYEPTGILTNPQTIFPVTRFETRHINPSIAYCLTGLFSAPTYVLFIVAPTNILLNYLLVWGPFPSLHLGFIGAPIATAISLNLITFFYCLYGLWIAPRVAWHPITKECLQELGILFKLGVSGVAQVAAEVSSKRFQWARSESE
jgi:hypothetical protein